VLSVEYEIPKETLEFFKGDELRARVFIEKYAMKDEENKLVEVLPTQMWKRVAKEIASVEQDKEKWEKEFYWMLEDFKVIPGGRILFGAGQNKYGRRATLNNCYVVPINEDSLEGIFTWMKEAARTYSLGGGVGVDISILRPKNSPVKNSAYRSIGSVGFMDLFSNMTGTISQEGRRGALMITIDVTHPDVLDFVKIKRDLKTVRYANISVKVNDTFMQAVKNDEIFTLQYKLGKINVEKKVRAKELWDEMLTSIKNYAEPGIIFWDNIKRESTSEYNGMNLLTTNPCSEIPLEPYGNCNLSNINLSYFVVNGKVDYKQLERAVKTNVRFLDDIVDYNLKNHPLEQQKKTAKETRRIGVGFTGLADMLIKLGIKYDSEEAIKFVDKLFEKMKIWAYEESIELAKEKGTFPLFDLEKHIQSPFIQRLPNEIKEGIKKYGLRNVALLTIPPVGSGSILAGTSSGIEPVFSFVYKRRSESLTKKEFITYHPLVKEYMEKNNIDDINKLPNYFVTAHEIDPFYRVLMQGTIQKHIDHSISSTINLPKTITKDEISKLLFKAWENGCKGITVYVDGSRENVLDKNIEEEKKQVFNFQRPEVLDGKTMFMNYNNNEKIYVTLNFLNKKPIEVFVNLGKPGSDERAYTEAIGRLISLYLQNNGDVDGVIHTLQNIRGSSITQYKNIKIYSVPDAVAKILQILTGKLEVKNPFTTIILQTNDKKDADINNVNIDNNTNNNINTNNKNDIKNNTMIYECPKCHEYALVYENGCYICKNCGYTKCD